MTNNNAASSAISTARKRAIEVATEPRAGQFKKFKELAPKEQEAVVLELPHGSKATEQVTTVTKHRGVSHVAFLTALEIPVKGDDCTVKFVASAPWWNHVGQYNLEVNNFHIYERNINCMVDSAAHHSALHVDYVCLGKMLVDIDQDKHAKQALRDSFLVCFEAVSSKTKSKKIDDFFTMCKNAHLCIERFGWGMLACDAILKNIKGNLWMRVMCRSVGARLCNVKSRGVEPLFAPGLPSLCEEEKAAHTASRTAQPYLYVQEADAPAGGAARGYTQALWEQNGAPLANAYAAECTAMPAGHFRKLVLGNAVESSTGAISVFRQGDPKDVNEVRLYVRDLFMQMEHRQASAQKSNGVQLDTTEDAQVVVGFAARPRRVIFVIVSPERSIAGEPPRYLDSHCRHARVPYSGASIQRKELHGRISHF
ncbi:hypothetical protein HDU86_005010 [Geranomyces michiganensis]|nr:hypothetical protein HDU86_005010 [Geranomyces michiganensis]